MEEQQVIVLTGAEKIVVFDDFICTNPERTGAKSGRTTRLALQYVLIAMKAAGITIECHDHVGGSPEKLQETINCIAQTLNLYHSCQVHDTEVSRYCTLRIETLNEVTEKLDALREEKQRRADEFLLERMKYEAAYFGMPRPSKELKTPFGEPKEEIPKPPPEKPKDRVGSSLLKFFTGKIK